MQLGDKAINVAYIIQSKYYNQFEESAYSGASNGGSMFNNGYNFYGGVQKGKYEGANKYNTNL